MSVDAIPVPNAAPAAGPYVPAVRAGDWVVCSGQLGLDPRTGTLVDGGPGAEARRALRNLRAVLADAGLSMAAVAKTTVFVTNLDAFGEVNAAYADAFGTHRPARSTVGVAALPLGASVEIEAWALVRS
jgi:2-iminobutanoate/2-iminopropanoate deaminase